MRKGEKSVILSSADSRGTGYPSKVRALDRHDCILGFAENDCSVKRLDLNGVKLYSRSLGYVGDPSYSMIFISQNPPT